MLVTGVFFALVAVVLPAVGSDISDPVRVFTNPDKTFFWRTAMSPSFTLRWDFPEGATSADLSVVGMNSSWSWNNLTETSKALTLPEPSTPRFEDVYWLVLAFDNGVTNTAQIAVVKGTGTSEASTVCSLYAPNRYLKTCGSTVIPVPYGVTEFAIDGEAVDTGLNGACGWYGWKPSSLGVYTLSLVSPETSVERDVRVLAGGVIIMCH